MINFSIDTCICLVGVYEIPTKHEYFKKKKSSLNNRIMYDFMYEIKIIEFDRKVNFF